jgi:hypothetical protein
MRAPRRVPALALTLVHLTLLASCHDGATPASSARPEAPPSPPREAPAAAVRYVIGGDSRGDTAHVIPWAFHEAKDRGVAAFIFLGDMEVSPDLDDHFRDQLAQLAPIPFFPVLGNHEGVRRARGAATTRDQRVPAIAAFRGRFLGKPQTPVESVFDDQIVYSVDLPGGVHFVALDNVSQPGFGPEQLAWLGKDLERAHAAPGKTHLIVAMHKPFAGNGITDHAMDEDGPAGAADSAAALALCEHAGVELIVGSHFHGFAEYVQHGIRSFITGGLGAPLDIAPTKDGKEHGFHHLLVVGVPVEGALTVEVVRFPGPPALGRDD